MPPFIVVVVYNYRIAYFVEVFLYQLAQQVNLDVSGFDTGNVTDMGGGCFLAAII